jgi:glycogen synthase
MNRHRVLTLGWEFPPQITGGLGVACHGLCQALAKYADLTVVLPTHPPEITSKGFQVRSCYPASAPSFPDPYTTTELYAGDLAQKVLEFSSLVENLALLETFDLIHAHDWMTFPAGLVVKKAIGKPLVLHVHSLQYDRAGPGIRDWIYQLERDAMAQADCIIPVSHYTGEIIATHYGIPRSKIRPIHHGIEPVVASQTPQRSAEKLVLFLGRLTSQKGPEIFLETALRVSAQNPNTRFVIAGAGEKMPALMASAASRQLGPCLRFTGFLTRDQVQQLFAQTTVYCMPSVSEPFGLAALEAAQFGVPTVISRQSGVVEVLTSALQADSWDVPLMAHHITQLLTDDALHRRHSAQARLDIAASTWDAAAMKVLVIYHELLSR